MLHSVKIVVSSYDVQFLSEFERILANLPEET